MQPEYLLKHYGSTVVGQSPTDKGALIVRFARKSRPAKDQPLPGLRMVEDAGPNRGRVEIGPVARLGRVGCWLTRDGVNATIRRLRPQEAAQLDGIDREVDALVDRLRELREAREKALQAAFRAGHKVTVRELRELAELRESQS